MALTPEDVVNKRFQPTKFREGYDQDEVDDFLDEVVVELRRLNQENEELRQRLIASDSRISELQRSGAQPAPAAAPAPVEAAPPAFAAPQPAPIAEAPAPTPAAAAPGSALAYAPPTSDPSGLDTNNTNNLLQLARRLHEEHVREGVEKRDALIAEGQATAARVVAEAEAKQRAQLGALDQERSTLEARIDELRTFEREYRQKLKGYIEGQLRELDSTSPVLTSAPTAAPSAGQSGPVAAEPAAQAAPAPVAAPVSAPVSAPVPVSAPAPVSAPVPVSAPAPTPAQTFASPVAPPPANYPGFASN
jgi:DivIVA domain-containing protein